MSDVIDDCPPDEASDLVSISAFGHRFEDCPSELAEDLIMLEREGAVYSHFADMHTVQPDGTAQFRYYRIPLTPREIFEFVEASVAYQESRREAVRLAAEGRKFTGDGEWLEACLRAVTRPEIVERVRRYGDYGHSKLKDGREVDIRGCLASFYPDGLEALMCGARHERYEELPELTQRDNLALVMKMLNNVTVAARFLSDRKHSRPPFEIESEYDVQDLIYTLLRSVFDDARKEEWTPQRAGSSKRMDVLLPGLELVLEVKYVRDRAHARTVADELRIDFECYHAHPQCRQLVAFVWDPDRHLSDPAQFSEDLSGLRQKDDHSFNVTVLVR